MLVSLQTQMINVDAAVVVLTGDMNVLFCNDSFSFLYRYEKLK